MASKFSELAGVNAWQVEVDISYWKADWAFLAAGIIYYEICSLSEGDFWHWIVLLHFGKLWKDYFASFLKEKSVE